MKKGPNQPPPPITPKFNEAARNPPQPITPKFNEAAGKKPPPPPPPAVPNGPGPRNPPPPITPKFNEVARKPAAAPPKANSSGLRNPPPPITPKFNDEARKKLQKKQDAHDLNHNPPGASNRSPERQAKIDAITKQVNERVSKRLTNGPKL